MSCFKQFELDVVEALSLKVIEIGGDWKLEIIRIQRILYRELATLGIF